MSLTKKSLSGLSVRLAANIYKPNGLSAKHKLSGILLVPGWAVSKSEFKTIMVFILLNLVLLCSHLIIKAGDKLVVLSCPLKHSRHSKGATKLDINVTQIRKIVEPMSMLARRARCLVLSEGRSLVCGGDMSTISWREK